MSVFSINVWFYFDHHVVLRREKNIDRCEAKCVCSFSRWFEVISCNRRILWHYGMSLMIRQWSIGYANLVMDISSRKTVITAMLAAHRRSRHRHHPTVLPQSILMPTNPRTTHTANPTAMLLVQSMESHHRPNLLHPMPVTIITILKSKWVRISSLEYLLIFIIRIWDETRILVWFIVQRTKMSSTNNG